MFVSEDKSKRFGPYQVVRLFERCLNDVGNSITFTPESSEPQQLNHARRLLVACKYCEAEVRAVLKEYCRDEWLVANQPDLAFVVRKADELRARMTQRQRAKPVEVSWEDLE